VVERLVKACVSAAGAVLVANSLMILCLPAFASDGGCDDLRKRYSRVDSTSHEEKHRFISELQQLISEQSLCAKNLLGRLYYEGKIVSQDVDRAHGIFFDLAEKSYPPAMYNLAYLSVKEGRDSTAQLLVFIHGLIVRFSTDSEWVRIAAQSRELGYEALDLALRLQHVTPQEHESLLRLHREVSEKSVADLAALIGRRDSEVRALNKGVGDILLLATTLYAVGSLASGGTLGGGGHAGRCDYFSCRPYLSTGDLYNFGILK
jgi:hypothetical protein